MKNKPTILKTNMREAFEAIKISDKTPMTLLDKVFKHLQKNTGIIYRKKMWAVLRG